jgi:WD40 repeat protein
METLSKKFEIRKDESDEEFFDAYENFEDIEPNAETFRTHSFNRDFSPNFKFSTTNPNIIQKDFFTEQSTFKTIKNKNTRTWKPKDLKKKNKDYFEFSNLSLVQELNILQKETCIFNFSPDGRFITIAGEDPVICLYEICRQKFVDEQYLLYDEAFENYVGHTSGVTSLSWSQSSLFFLSSAQDGMIYKWSIGQKNPIAAFKHSLEVVCVSLHPQNQDIFLSGCKDHRLRIWNISSALIDSELHLEEFITAAEFSPRGLIVVGLANGYCLVLTYNVFSRSLEILNKISCRNKRGLKSSGRKITGVDFVSDEAFLVTSNDSRIRLFDTEKFEIKQKYKGLKNEVSKIVATIGKASMHVISGSENGNIYIWNLYSKLIPKLNPVFTHKKKYKNSSYEYFKIDSSKGCSYARLAPEKVLQDVQRRYNASKKNVLVNNIIIAAKNGYLLVFYDKEGRVSTSRHMSKSLLNKF